MPRSATEPQPGAPRKHGSLFLLAGFALAGFAILCGLGLWQLRRLEWKLEIISRIEARMKAQAEPLPPSALWPALAGGDYEYKRVRVRGVFEHDMESFVFRASGAGAPGPGFHVLTPLRLADGSHVIVNRGFVPEALRDRAKRTAGQIAGETRITGFLRAPEERNNFTPADRPTEQTWYTRDPIAIARALQLERAAPFVIDADATPNRGGWPKGGATVVTIRNDHLSYALTWFGLAATLLAIFGLVVWRRVRTDT